MAYEVHANRKPWRFATEYEGNAALFAEAPAMLEALRWALGALEKCPPPKEKRGNLDTVAARAWHGRARGDIQRIIARIDGAAPATPENEPNRSN